VAATRKLCARTTTEVLGAERADAGTTALFHFTTLTRVEKRPYERAGSLVLSGGAAAVDEGMWARNARSKKLVFLLCP